MCGIFCYISTNGSSSQCDQTLQSCLQLLQNRGPNHDAKVWYASKVLFYGSVLWHQGSMLCKQPVETEETVLLFNGDVFQERENIDQSDTVWLLERIESCQSEDELCHLFANLHGPYSVVFLRKRHNRIYFGRDRVGRNSLLYGRSQDGSGDVFISSVTGHVANSVIDELPPYGLYYMDLDQSHTPLGLFPWTDDCTEIDQLFAGKIKVEQKNVLQERQFLNDFPPRFSFHSLLGNGVPPEHVYDFLCTSAEINLVSNQLLSTLRTSVRERVRNTTKACKLCIEKDFQCLHAKVGILFSGGIDCTILALLADEFVPEEYPIDLLNVAFEKINRSKAPPTGIDWSVPDRLTGRASLDELRHLRPKREWNFVEINVTRNELNDQRTTVSNLVYPLRNVLDESLGAALWFASKGVGLVNEKRYTSTCRVLLLGSGADELFGGYTRHKVAFERCLHSYRGADGSDDTADSFQKAFEALEDELNLDWRRLPSRNLARDDRVISDNGVTPRTPYLQEDFIAVVRTLKASQRCYHPLGPGVGDKLILRICAYKLGLTNACTLKKRALQFGSRIADRKQNASDRSTYLAE